MYDQPSPPQHPYQPPQNPYQQQQSVPPYAQQPAHLQHPPHRQYPYAQPAPPAHPSPAAATTPVHTPRHADDMRRIGAYLLDGLLFLGICVLALRAGSSADLPFSKVLLIVAGCGFGFSFLNHVVLTRLTGASIAKFATRTRVILQKTGARPHLPRLFRRWLGGYLVVVIWLIAALFDSADDDGPDDFCGIRLVRRRDLRRPGTIY